MLHRSFTRSISKADKSVLGWVIFLDLRAALAIGQASEGHLPAVRMTKVREGVANGSNGAPYLLSHTAHPYLPHTQHTCRQTQQTPQKKLCLGSSENFIFIILAFFVCHLTPKGVLNRKQINIILKSKLKVISLGWEERFLSSQHNTVIVLTVQNI